MMRKIVLAGAFALAATAAQADHPTKVYSITIDGDCDTFVATFDEVTGFVTAQRGGCNGTNNLAGMQAITDYGYGVTLGETADRRGLMWFFTAPVRGHGNVYLYRTFDGMSENLIFSGTYTRVRK